MTPQHNGGYIFAPAHNIQVDVSPQALVHLYTQAHSRQAVKQ
jgi:hypothetical protein